jgi:formamidopyrimidine-DNA glycosylase
MPELPELEAFKKYVQLHALHKPIADIASADKAVIKKISFPQFKKELIGHSFAAVQREGKYLVISISSSDETLIMHFGLTGFLIYSKKKDEQVRFSAVQFIFKDGSVLHWCSVRKFGKLYLVEHIDQIKELSHLGPNPLNLSKKEFIHLMEENKKKNIKAFLLDQSIISGIGNEYSDEILFQSGIAPMHKIQDLSAPELTEIYKEMHKILKFAVKLRTKKSNLGKRFFSDQDNGIFPSSYLITHRHSDMLCPKNKNHHLKKVTIAGRSAYYCPKDQK